MTKCTKCLEGSTKPESNRYLNRYFCHTLMYRVLCGFSPLCTFIKCLEESFEKSTLEKSHTSACKYDASVSWQRGRSEASAIVQSFPNNRFISHPASTSHPGFGDETQLFLVKCRKLRKIFLFWSLRLLHKLKLNRPKCISRFFYVDSSPPKTQTICWDSFIFLDTQVCLEPTPVRWLVCL